jgi:Predicted membrane protein (DUF2306)
MKVIKTVIQWLLGILVFLLVVSLSFNALSYLNFNFTYGFLRLPAYYSHVLAAGLILALGLFQLRTTLSLRWRKLHRFLGKCYAYGILFFAAPGGLVMSFFIHRGPWVLISFVLQSLLWFVFTALAVRAIKQSKFEEHGRWMWRSYALTFAAVTLRLYVFLFTSSYDMSTPEAYGIIAWLSWTINLVAVEIYLRLRSSPIF